MEIFQTRNSCLLLKNLFMLNKKKITFFFKKIPLEVFKIFQPAKAVCVTTTKKTYQLWLFATNYKPINRKHLENYFAFQKSLSVRYARLVTRNRNGLVVRLCASFSSQLQRQQHILTFDSGNCRQGVTVQLTLAHFYLF